MDKTPRKDVRVWEVWNNPSGLPAATFMQFFEEEFARGNIAVAGLRSYQEDGKKIERRVLIDSPLDYSIDWPGTRPRSGAGDYAVAARRREVPSTVDDYLGVQRTSSTDIFEDLTVSETDWDRMCSAVAERVAILRANGRTSRRREVSLNAAQAAEEEAAGAQAAGGTQDASVDQPDGQDTLRLARDAEIHKAITAAYDETKALEGKPPNINEIIKPVQALLRAAGLQTSGRNIQKLAGCPQHSSRRGKVGKTHRQPKSKAAV